MTAPTLSAEDRAVLQFEDLWWWREPGAKDQAIVDLFGVSPVRHYQRLARLIDDPAALAAEPLIVGRLRRIRDGRGRRLGRRSAR